MKPDREPGALDELEHQLERLANSIRSLEQRLEGALQPIAEPKHPELAVEPSNRLQGQLSRLARLSANLEELTSRVDL